MRKKKKSKKQLVWGFTFLSGSTSCLQEVKTALTTLHAEMQLYVDMRSELTFSNTWGKKSKQKYSNQLAQQHSSMQARGNFTSSWKRNYVTSASPSAIPAEQHQFYPTRITAGFLKERRKKMHQSNSLRFSTADKFQALSSGMS